MLPILVGNCSYLTGVKYLIQTWGGKDGLRNFRLSADHAFGYSDEFKRG